MHKPSPHVGSSSEPIRSYHTSSGQLYTFLFAPTTQNTALQKQRHAINAEKLWIPAGNQITIHDFTIPGGLLYVGRGLSPVADHSDSTEPALINPSLKVSTRHLDRAGQTFSYWPSYHKLQPRARGAYLEWLANGRSDPKIGIGYVFLFFYGLERRLLADAPYFQNAQNAQKAQEERSIILHEVESLLELYGHHMSFRNYARNFLTFFHIRDNNVDALLWEPDQEFHQVYSTLFKFHLGHLSKHKRPIPFNLAFFWWMNHPNTRLRSPATRCPQEFARLFEIKYKSTFGQGMVVKPNKTTLSISYETASSSFGYQKTIEATTKLPDLTVLSAPIKKLEPISESCTEQLESYSRFIGRRPGEKDSLTSLGLLPKELLEIKQEILQPLLDFLKEQLQHDAYRVIDAHDLLAFWPLADQTKVTKAVAVSMAQLLASMGMGMEPDIQFGTIKIHPEGKVCLFRLSDPKVHAPSPAFHSAEVVLHLAAVVAGADGIIDPEEEQQLELHLESILHLSNPEQERLRARLKWLLSAPPGLVGIKKRLAGIVTEKRRTIGEFLVAVAGADGQVDPSEIKILKKIYNLLQLDPESIHSDIHRLQTRVNDQPPLPLAPLLAPLQIGSGPGAAHFNIPAPPDTEKTTNATIQLDSNLVAETRKNTALVQQMLADVFVEEEPEPKPEPTEANVSSQSITTVQGLDDEHSKLFHHIIKNSQWIRADFDKMCDTMGLMPDGAIETINEAAYILLDEPVLDGDDPLDINQEIAQEMLV